MAGRSLCSLTETEGCAHRGKVFKSPLLRPSDAEAPALPTLWRFVENVSSDQVKTNRRSYLQMSFHDDLVTRCFPFLINASMDSSTVWSSAV